MFEKRIQKTLATTTTTTNTTINLLLILFVKIEIGRKKMKEREIIF